MGAPDLYRLPRPAGGPAAGLSLGAVGAVVGVIGLATWAATQYAAYRFRFHPALGVPLLVVPVPYRGLLGSAAVLAGGLGAGCAAARWWRAAAAFFGAVAFLLALQVGPLYAPLNFFVWWWRFGSVGGTAPIWRVGKWLVLLPSHLAVILAVVAAVRRARTLGGPADTHGSARWARREDLKAAGLIGQDAGVYVGAWAAGRTLHYLRQTGPHHVRAFA